MDNILYVVKYSGPFGFVKPWTAVRDSETFSQQFLTPSIVEGIEVVSGITYRKWDKKNKTVSIELLRH